MLQIKVNIQDKALIEFVDQFSVLGYKDRSELTRAALECLKQKKEAEKLAQSAQIYSKLYEQDDDLRKLTDYSVLDLSDDV